MELDSNDDRMRTLELLLKIEPQATSDASVAAKMILELSVATGVMSAIFLIQNGEQTFGDILSEISSIIAVSARDWVDIDSSARDAPIAH